MPEPSRIELVFAPTGELVSATIIPLTDKMIVDHISGRWWTDESLKDHFDPLPIDRYWNWNEIQIDYDGRVLPCQKVAVVAGPSGEVQGAMMISTEPVPSILVPNERGLFVELLFTAPRNRKDLRKDGGTF